MAQPHGKHHHQNHPKSYSWAAILSGVLIVSTLALVGTQVFQARRIAGSRSLIVFGRRKLHRVVHFSEYKQVIPELLDHAEPHFTSQELETVRQERIDALTAIHPALRHYPSFRTFMSPSAGKSPSALNRPFARAGGESRGVTRFSAEAAHYPFTTERATIIRPDDVLPRVLPLLQVAFTSGVDSQGRPWCRDCAAAMPIIREVVLGAGGSLLEVSVGKREDWANRQHPMRVDSDCPVRFVPTLYYWSEKGCGSSVANPLNSDETEESLRLIVAKFVQQTASGQRYVDRITREIIQSGGKGCGGC